MFDDKTDQELIDHVLGTPSATDEELALVDRMLAQLAEIDRLTSLVAALQEVSRGEDA